MRTNILTSPVRYPEELEHALSSSESFQTIRTELGEDPRWAWSAAQMFKVLASPTAGVSVPRSPYRGGEEMPGVRHEEILAWWSAIHSIVLFRLGWTDPAKGIFAGRRLGESVELDLLEHLWSIDHQDLIYAAWAERRRFDILGKGGLPHDRGDANLQNAFAQIKEERFYAVCFGGGTDPHHLTMHVEAEWASANDSNPGRLVITDPAAQNAILVFENALGWYGGLVRQGATLAGDSTRSWRFDVYVKTIGFMGTYRRSRETGIWFTGKHSIHMGGN